MANTAPGNDDDDWCDDLAVPHVLPGYAYSPLIEHAGQLWSNIQVAMLCFLEEHGHIPMMVDYAIRYVNLTFSNKASDPTLNS